MKVKVCGLKNNWKEVAALKPDWCGFIFYAKSPRFIGEKLKEEIRELPISKVGVFVNESVDYIANCVSGYGLQFVQLHGDESVGFILNLKACCPDVKIIKVFRINDELPGDLNAFNEVSDYFLFDTKVVGYGGQGKSFDWSVLNDSSIQVPFLLAGGVGLSDWESIKEIRHPQFVGVDINSRFEDSPGTKNIEKVREFLKIVRNE